MTNKKQMSFDWNALEKEKEKLPLHKQTGTTFNPPEKEDNKKESKSSFRKPILNKTTKSNGKDISMGKTIKPSRTKKPKLSKQEEKQEVYKEFKNKLGLSPSDIVIDYMDKVIRSLQDLVEELNAKKEEAKEQFSIKE